MSDLGKALFVCIHKMHNTCSYLDSNNILYKIINGKLVGKRAIQTNTLRNCWLEDLKPEETIKAWYDETLDYNEIFD